MNSFKKNGNKQRRAQLLSLDFLIAVSLTTVALAVFMHYDERIEKSFAEYGQGSNKADVTASVLLGEASAPLDSVYCAQYSNGSTQGTCPVDCGKTVFSSMRLTQCGASACLMVVSSCD